MGLFLNLTKWFWRYLNFSAAKKGIFLDEGPYIDVHMEGGWGSLEICHVFEDSIVFKQQIYCLFLQMVGVGGEKIGHFLWTT